MVDEYGELILIRNFLSDETNLRKSPRIRNQKFEQAKLLLSSIKENYKANVKGYTIDVWQEAINIFRELKSLLTMPFDLKTATSVVLPYDGSPESIDAFVDSANLLDEITEQNYKATAIKFLKTRLTGRARLGLGNNHASIADLVKEVQQKCEQKSSSEEVIAKLNAIREKDHDKICDLVDNLTNKLSAVYLADKVPADVAQKMATKHGVDTLMKKISNHDVKIILKAGSFNTIQQAIQKVRENSSSDVPPQILSFRTSNRGRRNGPQRHTMQQFPHQQRYQYSTLNRGRGFQNYGNRGRGSRYQNPRQNYYNNGPRANFPPRNVYLAEMGNNQPPQPGGVGGPMQFPTHQHQTPCQNPQMMPQPGQVSISHLLQRQ